MSLQISAPLAKACPLVEARDSRGSVRPWSRGWEREVKSLLTGHSCRHFMMATGERSVNLKTWDLSTESPYSDLTWRQEKDTTKLVLR